MSARGAFETPAATADREDDLELDEAALWEDGEISLDGEASAENTDLQADLFPGADPSTVQRAYA